MRAELGSVDTVDLVRQLAESRQSLGVRRTYTALFCRVDANHLDGGTDESGKFTSLGIIIKISSEHKDSPGWLIDQHSLAFSIEWLIPWAPPERWEDIGIKPVRHRVREWRDQRPGRAILDRFERRHAGSHRDWISDHHHQSRRASGLSDSVQHGPVSGCATTQEAFSGQEWIRPVPRHEWLMQTMALEHTRADGHPKRSVDGRGGGAMRARDHNRLAPNRSEPSTKHGVLQEERGLFDWSVHQP